MANVLNLYYHDPDSGDPIVGAEVGIYSTDGDTLVASGTTDATGLVTLSGMTGEQDHYVTATKSGYFPFTKEGTFNNGYLLINFNASSSPEITLYCRLQPTRAKTAILVTEGAGAAIGTPQTPVAGATVVVKNSATDATIETLTTNADGVALMNDDEYSGVTGIKVVVSKTSYTTKTAFLGSANPGDNLGVSLVQAPSVTTYTLTGRLITASGVPVSGRRLTMQYVDGIHSLTSGGKEFYVTTGTRMTADTDTDGIFTFTIVDGAVVKPVGWGPVFGYPDSKVFVINGANIDLGDGTAGKL